MSSPLSGETGDTQDRIVRHKLTDRLYHWTMAASVLTLMGTAFFPILGFKFPWVTAHWIAGVVLTILIVIHIVRAVIWQDFWAMVPNIRDGRDLWRALRRGFTGSGPTPGKTGKYEPLQKMFHLGAVVIVLTLVVTGCFMLAKIDGPFWNRNPYFLSSATWGWVYVLHGLSAMVTVTMVIIHIYFGLRPEKLWFTRSMILGWITRSEYDAHFEPALWDTDGEKPPRPAAGASDNP